MSSVPHWDCFKKSRFTDDSDGERRLCNEWHCWIATQSPVWLLGVVHDFSAIYFYNIIWQAISCANSFLLNEKKKLLTCRYEFYKSQTNTINNDNFHHRFRILMRKMMLSWRMLNPYCVKPQLTNFVKCFILLNYARCKIKHYHIIFCVIKRLACILLSQEWIFSKRIYLLSY